MARLFLAIWPDGSVRRAISDLERPAQDGVRWSDPSNWHVTLRFIGDASIDDVMRRLRDAALPAAKLSFGPRVEQLGDRVVIIPVAGAEELAAAVRGCTGDIGLADARPFVGHLTLARRRPGADVRLTGTTFSAEQEVRRIALVRSELGTSGPTYTDVATFDCR